MRESASDIVFRQKKVINIVQDVYEESDLGGNYKYSHIGTYSPVFDKDGNVEYVVAEIHLLNDIVMRYQDAVSLPGAPHITQINMEPLRELCNFVERMLITSMPDVHIINQVPEGIMQTLDLTQDRINCNVKHSENVERRINDPYGQIKYDEDFSLQAYMDNCEKTLLQDALKKYKTTYRVAEVLKINQSNVLRKRKKYGLLAHFLLEI